MNQLVRVGSFIPAAAVAAMAAIQLGPFEQQVEASALYEPVFIGMAFVCLLISLATITHIVSNRRLTLGERTRWLVAVLFVAIVAIPLYVSASLQARVPGPGADTTPLRP